MKLTEKDLPFERPQNFEIPKWDEVSFDKNSMKMIYKIPSHRRYSEISVPSKEYELSSSQLISCFEPSFDSPSTVYQF